jgi:hypothetical protein
MWRDAFRRLWNERPADWRWKTHFATHDDLFDWWKSNDSAPVVDECQGLFE